ncbi:MAG: hypothetical protein NT007_14180, partial [Candidatus Kapabacteria bacterium]|nr:hypothetical protein [Candidatus Kapabacteria bacterium]
MNKNYSYFSAIAVIAIIFVSLNTKLKAYDDWEKIKGPFTGQFTCFGEDMSNHVFAGSWGDGVYQLSGTGTTWIKVSINLPDQYITCMFIDSLSRIFVGTNSGLFLSSNAGVNWSSISNGITNLSVKCILRLSNGNLLVGTNGGGIFRTSNLGSSWVEANNGLWFRDVNTIIQNLLGIVVTGTNGGGLYYSTDTCKTWKKGNSTTTSPGKRIDFVYQMKLQFEGSIYATTPNRGVIYSADGIGWFEQDSVGMTDYNTYALTFNAKKFSYIGTRANGMLYHDDFQFYDWRHSNSWYGGAEAIFKTSNGNMYAAVAMGGILLSTDNGKGWMDHAFYGKPKGITQICPGKNGIMFATHYPNGAFASTNYGLTWNAAGLDTFNINAFCYDTSNNILAATTRGIYRSTNIGLNWTKLYDSAAWCIATAKNGNLLAGGTNYYRSVNNGATWSISSIDAASGVTSSLAVNANGDIYAYCYQGLYKSVNAGVSFSKIINNTILPKCNGIYTNNLGHIYIAADSIGIYFSTNNFTTYSKDTLGISPRKINYIAFNSLNIPFAGSKDYIGLYQKDSVEQWHNLNSNISLQDVQCLVSNDRGNIFTSTDAIYTRMDSNKLTAPTLISPPSGTTGLSLSPSFAWSATNNAETYYFEISTDPNFSFAYEFRVQSTTFTNIDRILNYGTKYYWRTRAKFNNVLSAAQ